MKTKCARHHGIHPASEWEPCTCDAQPSKKTLAIILHHNTIDITTRLYNELKPYEGDVYDLIVIDNGSSPDKRFPNAEVVKKQNTFYGGGLREGFLYFRAHKKLYDSLLFLNSDLVVFGPTYVRTLRAALMEHPGFKIISPAVCGDWNGNIPLHMHKQMNSWGAREIREVKYCDFQTPMFHADYVNTIDYPDDLVYGIGQDTIAGKLCADRGWKIGVIDWMVAYHMWAHTIRSGNAPLKLNAFAQVSNEVLDAYALKAGLTEHIAECMKYGREYVYTK